MSGELGWEIYIPSDYAPGALDLLLEEGRGVRPEAGRACTP